jgi:hypothetical protein
MRFESTPGTRGRTSNFVRGAVTLAALALALVVPGTAFAQAIVTTDPAVGITATSAELRGTVNPNGVPTKWYFEYATHADFGLTGTYTNATAPQLVSALGPVPNPSFPATVAAVVNGLAPRTTYHFRIVAEQSQCTGSPFEAQCPFPTVTSFGQDRTFKTLKR